MYRFRSMRDGVFVFGSNSQLSVRRRCGTDVQSLGDCVIHALPVQSCYLRFVLGRYSLGAHRL